MFAPADAEEDGPGAEGWLEVPGWVPEGLLWREEEP